MTFLTVERDGIEVRCAQRQSMCSDAARKHSAPSSSSLAPALTLCECGRPQAITIEHFADDLPVIFHRFAVAVRHPASSMTCLYVENSSMLRHRKASRKNALRAWRNAARKLVLSRCWKSAN